MVFLCDMDQLQTPPLGVTLFFEGVPNLLINMTDGDCRTTEA